MSRWKRPLRAAEVRNILKNLGFTPRPQKGTSHEHWVREGEPFRKVTLSAHNEPFDDFIVSVWPDRPACQCGYFMKR